MLNKANHSSRNEQKIKSNIIEQRQGSKFKRQQQQQQQQQQQRLNSNDFNRSSSANKMGFRLFMSEFMGTFVYVYLAQSTVTSFELIGTQNDILNRQLAIISISGLAFLLATFLTLNLSGSHLNPAYTLASTLFNHLSWARCLQYILAQYLGAFFAAIFLHATYSDKLAQRHLEGLLIGSNSTHKAHGNILSTGKLFSSFPPNEVSLTQLFISYTLASTTLMIILLTVHKSELIKVPRCLKPFYLSIALISIQASFSANGGPVLNPAQDFSTRLYISMFGWGLGAFNLYSYNYWWFCGILAPHLGALIGFGLYKLLAHLNNIEDGKICSEVKNCECQHEILNNYKPPNQNDFAHQNEFSVNRGVLEY